MAEVRPESSPLPETTNQTLKRLMDAAGHFIEEHGKVEMVDGVSIDKKWQIRIKEALKNALPNPSHYQLRLTIPQLAVDWEGSRDSHLKDIKVRPRYNLIQFNDLTITKNGKIYKGNPVLKYQEHTRVIVLADGGLDYPVTKEDILQTIDEQINSVHEYWQAKGQGKPSILKKLARLLPK